MSTLNIPTARVFKPALEPSRYKALHGGRGSGKSHFFGEKLIDDSQYHSGLLSVCIREVQKSLKQSSKRLIEKKLTALGLGEKDGFKVFNEVIQTPGDGVIMFQGMQDHNAETIKSLEGFMRAWVEEAQTLSAHSLTLLRPTIRGDGEEKEDDSEIWFSWNPRRKNDPVDMLFRGGSQPTGSIILEANWRDNPWFPRVLKQERIDCLNNQPEDYNHIWEGGYKMVTEGAYYAKDIAKARGEGRITWLAPDPLITYGAFIDIGGTGARADAFTIWIAQFVGDKIKVLNYYEAQGQPLETHLAWMRDNKYTTENTTFWLPHDGSTNDRVYDVSYESALKGAGYEVEVIPNQGKGAAKARVEATRRLWNKIWIDEGKCQGGLDALGWYHEKKDEVRNIGLGPEHDWASHGADAFGLMCVVYEEPRIKKSEPIEYESEFN